MTRATTPAVKTRVTFMTEQHVGLKTYSDNLRRFADADPRIVATWRPITYLQEGGLIERIAVLPSGIRGALRGRSQVRNAIQETDPHVCLYLTQTPVALGGALARRAPYVVMVDDTPILYDSMAEHYDEPPDRFLLLRRWKHRINVKGLRGAAKVLPMSEWARSSLIDDYGVQPSRTAVTPTGIDLEVWKPGNRSADGPMRILFVGGDFERKGGGVLLDAFARLPAGTAELHIVTRSSLDSRPGVELHFGLQPNSSELIELFRSSDVFVLVSRGEAFPNVLVEAAASGLPAIVSNVGGMAEMVVDNETGFVIEPDDVDRLEQLLMRLAENRDERQQLGIRARQRAEETFDGRENARRVVDYLIAAAAASPEPSRAT